MSCCHAQRCTARLHGVRFKAFNLKTIATHRALWQTIGALLVPDSIYIYIHINVVVVIIIIVVVTIKTIKQLLFAINDNHQVWLLLCFLYQFILLLYIYAYTVGIHTVYITL